MQTAPEETEALDFVAADEDAGSRLDVAIAAQGVCTRSAAQNWIRDGRVDKIQRREDLKIEEGEDLCTLVTCTPYGINTHRLLVRGHRVANREEAEAVRVTADAMQVDNRIVAACIAVPVLLILLAGIFVSGRRKR